MGNYIAELQAAILKLHGCEATHIETVPVTEIFQGARVWQGEVEVFEIRGHPKAKRCYAWGHVAGETNQGSNCVTVLELPPVYSPETALKAAIMAEIKNAREKTKGRAS